MPIAETVTRLQRPPGPAGNMSNARRGNDRLLLRSLPRLPDYRENLKVATGLVGVEYVSGRNNVTVLQVPA